MYKQNIVAHFRQIHPGKEVKFRIKKFPLKMHEEIIKGDPISDDEDTAKIIN